jgi:hypothetical protein
LGTVIPTVIAVTANMIFTTIQVAFITTLARMTVRTPATIFALNC